jgi:8-oxo-dGTP pyrophosphatase MutT (NUDIX family)
LGLPPAEAGAVVRAAAREVFEEAGVLLAGPRPGTVVGDVSGPGWEADRRSLAAHDLAFSDLLTRRGLRLRDDLLTGWARWITPEFEPRRFDTYFFLAVLPEGQRTRDVSGEADRTAWLSPADAVAGHAAGDLPMLPPTVVTLRELSAYRSIAGATAAAAERDVARPVLPKVEPTPDGGARMVLS